jgi:hypothetical protein
LGTGSRVTLLTLVETPRASLRQRRRFTATLLLASGTYHIEAQFGGGDAEIVGLIEHDDEALRG